MSNDALGSLNRYDLALAVQLNFFKDSRFILMLSNLGLYCLYVSYVNHLSASAFFSLYLLNYLDLDTALCPRAVALSILSPPWPWRHWLLLISITACEERAGARPRRAVYVYEHTQRSSGSSLTRVTHGKHLGKYNMFVIKKNPLQSL